MALKDSKRRDIEVQFSQTNIPKCIVGRNEEQKTKSIYIRK